jgi:hypothetical protein
MNCSNFYLGQQKTARPAEELRDFASWLGLVGPTSGDGAYRRRPLGPPVSGVPLPP